MILEFITKIVFFFHFFYSLVCQFEKERKDTYHLFDCSKKYQILKKNITARP